MAIAMTLVATVALGSSTYAWFAVNGKVTATGMNFKTTVSNNLFIANEDSTNKADNDAFFTTLVQHNDEKLLEPVSTINGETFFYAEVGNVVANGDTKTDNWVAYDPTSLDGFTSNYDADDAVGYIDYTYQLKAITGSSNPNILLTQLKITYGGDPLANDNGNASQAFRVAVFAQDITPSTPGTNTLKMIYASDDSEYFTTATSGDDTFNQAVETATALGNVTLFNDDITLATHANTDAGYESGTYYLITVRLWLEGEDKTCNNTTFANLTDAWRLDMAWELDSAEAGTPVENIELAATTAYAIDFTTATGVTVATDATVIAGENYYKLSVQVDSKDVYVDADDLENIEHVYVYDGTYLTDITNQCNMN